MKIPVFFNYYIKYCTLVFLNFFLISPFSSVAQDGMFDPAFGNNGFSLLSLGNLDTRGNEILSLPNGRILIGGIAVTNTSQNLFITKYLPDGSIDSSFSSDGTLYIPSGTNGNSAAHSFLQLQDGFILVSGLIDGENVLFKIDTSGNYDTSFGSNGTAIINPGSGYVKEQNGKFLLSGQYYDGYNNYYNLSRYNTDGSYDTSFGNNGILHLDAFTYRFDLIFSMEIQADQKILIAGTSYDDATDRKPVLVRLNPDGLLDATFGNNGVIIESLGLEGMGTFNAVEVQADGKIVAAGNMEYTNGSGGFGGTQPAVVKYHSDGTLDSSFASNGKLILNTIFNANDRINSMRIQPDNKIILGGTTGSAFPNIQSYYYITRINSDGSPDYSYGINGFILSDFYDSETNTLQKLAFQDDYKIITVGLSRDTGTTDFNAVVCRFRNSATLEIQVLEANDEFQLYPNPTSDFVYVESKFTNPDTKIIIYNLIGEIVLSKNLTAVSERTDIAFLPGGIYLVRLKSGNMDFTKKFIKN